MGATSAPIATSIRGETCTSPPQELASHCTSFNPAELTDGSIEQEACVPLSRHNSPESSMMVSESNGSVQSRIWGSRAPSSFNGRSRRTEYRLSNTGAHIGVIVLTPTTHRSWASIEALMQRLIDACSPTSHMRPSPCGTRASTLG